MLEKKLQVFVCSTYTDMKDIRQLAVQTIISAGHIPAGMELFEPDNKSQMQIIREWIKSSDVFVLILGGRYGSIEAESEKSYIQLEYEFADQTYKESFAIVLTEELIESRVKEMGSHVLEIEYIDKYRKFKEQVKSKLVAECDKKDHIRETIYSKLNALANRNDLVGWVRGDKAVENNPLIGKMAGIIEGHAPRWNVVRELEAEMAEHHSSIWAMQQTASSADISSPIELELRNVLDDIPVWKYEEDMETNLRSENRVPIHVLFNGVRYWKIRDYSSDNNKSNHRTQYLSSAAFHETLLWFRKTDRAVQEGIVLPTDLIGWWRQILPLGWSNRLTYFREYFESYQDIQSMVKVIVSTIIACDDENHKTAINRCVSFTNSDKDVLRQAGDRGKRAANVLPNSV